MLRQIEKILLATLLLLLPTQIGLHFWPDWSFVAGLRSDYLSPTIYLTDIVLFSLLVVFVISRQKLLLKPPSLLFILFLSLLAINTLLSTNPQISLYRAVRLVEYTGLALYVSSLKKVPKTIYAALAASLMWTFVLSIAQFTSQSSIGSFWYWLGERTFSFSTPGIALANYPDLRLRPYATFSHPNSLAGFTLVAFFVIWKQKGKFFTIAKTAAILILLLAASKTALLVGMAIGAFVLALRWPIRILAAALLTVAAIALVANNPKPSFERLVLAEAAVKKTVDHPFMGVGLGCIIPASYTELSYSERLKPFSRQPVHNIYLLFLAELGLPAFLLCAYFLKNFLRFHSTPAVWAVLATGFYDHYWLTLHQNTLIAALVIGLALHKHYTSGILKR